MSPELLALLRCPETRQRLSPATAGQLAELEARRCAGTLGVRSANPQFATDEPIDTALVREDGQVCYLVQRGIPLLLPDHGVAIG